MVTDDKNQPSDAAVDGESPAKGDAHGQSGGSHHRRKSRKRPKHERREASRPAADTAPELSEPAAPTEYEIESEGGPTGDDGQKGTSTGKRAAEEEPRRIDSGELISRLAERNEVIMELTRKNQTLENECNSLKDKLLRTAAEFDNFRKRTRKEWELLKQQAKADVILEVLHVVDDFERAFSVVADEESDFIQGIRLIYNNFVGALDKLGVEKIDAHHAPFDPSYHMAVGQIESEDVESGHVAEVVQPGYTLDQSVIRPARVVIAK